MRIAIIGHGKMGKTIERVAREKGYEVPLIIDLHNQHISKDLSLHKNKVDVAIEFSVPGIAFENIMDCIKAGIPVVSGTTGWLDQYDEVIDLTKRKQGTFFYSSNYSIGVNLFFEINKYAAKLLTKHPEYQISIEEIHHTEKLDKPSGTAITLANHILANNQNIKQWIEGIRHTKEDLAITSKRIEKVSGIHTTQIENEDEIIEIKHTAKSRLGFAYGALAAAHFVKDKKGVFGMSDLIGLG